MKLFILPAAILVFANAAGAIEMGLPVSCEYGKECFINSYFPYKTEEGVRDYRCGRTTREGEIGTRFMLRNLTQMQKGVEVVAAEKGVVEYVINDQPDLGAMAKSENKAHEVACGNRVIVRHGRGYRSEYCHLMQKSILVEVGKEVKKGEVLGKIGLSGLSDYPHLEFIVSKDNTPIDPFMGEDIHTCGKSDDAMPLWDNATATQLIYVPSILVNGGFAGAIPNSDGAKGGRFLAKELRNDEDMLVFWVDIMGVYPGDKLELLVTNPNGEVFAQRERVIENYQPVFFQYLGKKRRGAAWQKGKYTGTIKLSRTDKDSGEVRPVIDSVVEMEVK